MLTSSFDTSALPKIQKSPSGYVSENDQMWNSSQIQIDSSPGYSLVSPSHPFEDVVKAHWVPSVSTQQQKKDYLPTIYVVVQHSLSKINYSDVI